MKLRLPRSTPVVLLAAGCLLLGSTGGAVAGAMITGKQIKNNTVTTKDIKNGSLAVKDMSKSARKSLAGTDGATGARGASAWDTIPSGQTVSGLFFDAGRAGANPGFHEENIMFPGIAPAIPTGWGFGADVYNALTPTDPACTGTFEAPTAPAGRVCVYVAFLDNIDNVGLSGWDSDVLKTRAFYLEFSEDVANNAYNYYGSWAYTAP